MLKYQTINDMPLNAKDVSTNVILHKVASGELATNLLLYGAYGSGKSTLARHLPIWYQAAKGNEGSIYYDVDVPNDLDVSRLKRVCLNGSLNPSGYDWIVLDEVDKPKDKGALAKLHGVLEMNPQKLFILTANHLAMIPEGIQSRCVTVEIHAPSPSEYLPAAQAALVQRGKIKTDAFVLSLLNAAAGSGRDCRKYEQAIEMVT